MSIDHSRGVEGVLAPTYVPVELRSPKQRDFVPQGKRVRSHIEDYFEQEKMLNDEFVSEFVKPNIKYPNLMTPANFRQVLHVMLVLLEKKAREYPKGKKRIGRAHEALTEMQDNMSLLMTYLQSLMQV